MINNESKELLSSLSFCVFDLETTGGNQKSDKIIEIGMVNIDNLQIGEKVNFLVDPERKIPDFIQKLTSIKQADVEGCPKIEDLMDKILEIIGDRILVAHNASFDVPFLNSVLERMGRPRVENKSICTNLMTKYLIPTMMNSNLNYMSNIFNISHQKAHRALDDADATAKLFLNYLKIFEDKGVKKVNHLYYPKNRYELDLTNFKKESTTEEVLEKIKTIDSPFLLSLKGHNGIILSAFPCSGNEEELDHIQGLIEETDWETLTIKLVGPFTEVLIKFNHLFAKLNSEQKENVISKLWEFHIPNGDRSELKKSAKERLSNDFVIMNHLVPEQFTIYPMSALGHRNELVFRYPGHKKKLIQYINSKSNKMMSGKMRKVSYSAPLKEFLDCYMCTMLDKNTEILLFNKFSGKKDEEKLHTTIEKFLSKNPNTYNYPQKYI